MGNKSQLTVLKITRVFYFAQLSFLKFEGEAKIIQCAMQLLFDVFVH